ncbi:hydroxyproline-rich glycoprotein family protein, partial [Striga asiatica]
MWDRALTTRFFFPILACTSRFGTLRARAMGRLYSNSILSDDFFIIVITIFATLHRRTSFNLGLTRLAFYDIGLKAYSQARSQSLKSSRYYRYGGTANGLTSRGSNFKVNLSSWTISEGYLMKAWSDQDYNNIVDYVLAIHNFPKGKHKFSQQS